MILDNDKLKELCFKLLTKQPERVFHYAYSDATLHYSIDKDECIDIALTGNKILLQLPNTAYFTLSLTEKEFMTMKWKIEEWVENAITETINKAFEYASTNGDSMDTLLDD